MKRKISVSAILLLATAMLLSGCGLVNAIAYEVVDDVMSEVGREISYSVSSSVNGIGRGLAEEIVNGIVEDVMDQVFDNILAESELIDDGQKQELIAFDAEGNQLYTMTSNKEILERLRNVSLKVMQWKRSATVPDGAVLLYEYELWQEEQNSPLPVGERPLVCGIEASLYKSGEQYYLQATVIGDFRSTTDGWFIPMETAENMLSFTAESARLNAD